MTKPIETITITHSEFVDDDFKAPSKFYIKNSLGEMVFVKTRSRKDAQEFIDSEYGKGKYSIRVVVTASVR